MTGNHLESDVTDPGNPFLDRSLYKPQTKLMHAREEVAKATDVDRMDEGINKAEDQVEEIKENTKDRRGAEECTNPEILRL